MWFFCEFREISKNTFFYKTPLVTISVRGLRLAPLHVKASLLNLPMVTVTSELKKPLRNTKNKILYLLQVAKFI